MKTSSLELLEKSQLPPAQARAILQAMEAELDVRNADLATKSDLREVEHRLELKIEGVESRLIRWTFAFWVAQLVAIAGIVKLLK